MATSLHLLLTSVTIVAFENIFDLIWNVERRLHPTLPANTRARVINNHFVKEINYLYCIFDFYKHLGMFKSTWGAASAGTSLALRLVPLRVLMAQEKCTPELFNIHHISFRCTVTQWCHKSLKSTLLSEQALLIISQKFTPKGNIIVLAVGL